MHRSPQIDDFAHARLEPDEARSPFDLKVLVLYAVARFKAQLIAFAILGALGGLIAGAAQPNVYTVLSKLRFEPSARQVINEEAAFGVQAGDVARFGASAAVEQELELLGDPIIYERAVEAIGAEEILRVADPRSGDGPGASLPVKAMHGLQAALIHLKGLDDPCPDGVTREAIEAATKRLMANTKLVPIRRTNIIDVRYSDSSPAKAKIICEELLVQMRARHLEEYEATKQLEMLRAQKGDALQEFQAARDELREYQEQCGFWDLASDKAACQDALRAADTVLADLEATRQMLNGQILSLETDLDLRSEGSEAGEGRSYSQAYRGALEELAKVETEIDELGHLPTIGIWTQRTIDRKTAKAAKIREDIQTMDKYGGDPILAELDANIDPAIAEARALLAGYRADRLGVKAKMEAINGQLDKLEQKRANIAECEVNYARFESVLQSASAKYDRFAASEGNLASLAIMDQEERSNLTVFRAVRLPREKEGPQRSKPLIMGLVGGAAFGLGLAVLRQLLDRRVRYQETIENALGLRVLCVVPDLSSKAGFDATKGAA